jgi:hypothetical protein
MYAATLAPSIHSITYTSSATMPATGRGTTIEPRSAAGERGGGGARARASAGGGRGVGRAWSEGSQEEPRAPGWDLGARPLRRRTPQGVPRARPAPTRTSARARARPRPPAKLLAKRSAWTASTRRSHCAVIVAVN